VVGDGRDRAILAGDNSAQPRLLYLAPDVEVPLGATVVTSGHGGVFPPGLPVGLVSEIADGSVRVRPHVDWAHMEYVRLADYELPGLIEIDSAGPAISEAGGGTGTGPTHRDAQEAQR